LTTTHNQIFKQLLTEFDLTVDFVFDVEIPDEVQKIISDEISINEYGVTLKSFGGLYQANEIWNNQSLVEDYENHFHVDWTIDPADNKKAFMIGVRTLKLLADKFLNEKLTGIRFWFSFQTPELGRQHAKANNVDEDDDQYFISDRLSFYTRRAGEEVVTIDQSDKSFCALLVIDI
jgi:hypothetical protein